jgi:hypothetical protein
MSEIRVGNNGESNLPSAGGRSAVYHLTNGLRLAAAPTLLAMALLAGLAADGGGTAETLCLSADHDSLFGGMVPMYVLMATFHLLPWLELLFSQCSDVNQA